MSEIQEHHTSGENTKQTNGPSAYQHLFSLDSHKQEFEQLTIEDIYWRISEKDRNFHFDHKIVLFDVQKQNQDEHYRKSAEKASLYGKKTGIYFNGLAVICSAATLLPRGGGVFSLVAKMAKNTANSYDKKNESSLQGVEHHYQLIGRTADTYSQQMHAAHSAHTEATKFFEQYMQQKQRLIELFSQASG